jgi:hypothetical protein
MPLKVMLSLSGRQCQGTTAPAAQSIRGGGGLLVFSEEFSGAGFAGTFDK